MGLGKLKLSVDTAAKPVDPLKVFKQSTLRGSIENIWEPQAEALRGWHAHRDKPDVVVEMNTGGGKTLVGLLMARSLVNVTNERVLYVVANNQLVESPVSSLANPDHDLDVIELSGFRQLAENVKSMLEAVDAGDRSSLENSFEGWIRYYGLAWPTCLTALPNKLANELKAK